MEAVQKQYVIFEIVVFDFLTWLFQATHEKSRGLDYVHTLPNVNKLIYLLWNLYKKPIA